MMIKTIITAVITYLATSIDEIPVLFMFYSKAHNRGKGKIITAAYFTGTILLAAAGALGAFGLIQIPYRWAVGLIGLLPMAMGIKILLRGDEDEEEAAELAGKQKSLWAQVLVLTIALGADDVGVYIPLFTTLTVTQFLQMMLVFIIGTAVLCFISYRLTHIEILKEVIEKHERLLTGIVFIAIGIYVMAECSTFTKLAKIFH